MNAVTDLTGARTVRLRGDALRPTRRRRLGRDAVRGAIDLLRGIDVSVVVLSGLIADALYRALQAWRFESDYLRIIFAAGALTPLVFGYNGAYAQPPQRPGSALLVCGARAAAALFVSVIVLGAVMKQDFTVSRLWFAMWFALSFSGLIGFRVALIWASRRLERAGVLRETVAIVGATRLAALALHHLRTNAAHPVEVVGVFEDRRAARNPAVLAVDGSIDDLIELGKQRRIDQIILALPWSADARLQTLLTRLMALSVDVVVCPDETALAVLRMPVSDLSGLPTFRLAERPLRLWTLALKRAEDLVIGGLMLLAALPAMLVIAVLVKLDSPGPALFRQGRHGYNNREIDVLKFRTMRVTQLDPSGARQTDRDDERITPLGRWLRRFSLDELPQLLNVIKGDMSLVGPRPHPIGMRTENLLGEDIIDSYAHRHRVKPGLTGWAQVHGFRGATHDVAALMRRVEYDLEYIERWSLVLDLRIILMTPFSILTAKNAF